MTQAPQISCDRTADAIRFSLAGQWTVDSTALLEKQIAALITAAGSWPNHESAVAETTYAAVADATSPAAAPPTPTATTAT